MKTQVKNYTFNKTSKTITFNDYVSIDLDGILMVVNVTDGIVIYNFADPTKGGTVATNVLTLEYDTTSMDDADKLLIFYEDPDGADSVQNVDGSPLLSILQAFVDYQVKDSVVAMLGDRDDAFIPTPIDAVADASTAQVLQAPSGATVALTIQQVIVNTATALQFKIQTNDDTPQIIIPTVYSEANKPYIFTLAQPFTLNAGKSLMLKTNTSGAISAVAFGYEKF